MIDKIKIMLDINIYLGGAAQMYSLHHKSRPIGLVEYRVLSRLTVPPQ